MAKILLNVELKNDKLEQQLKAVKTSIESVVASFNKITPNKDLTEQLKALTEHYKTLAQAAEKVTTAQAKKQQEDNKVLITVEKLTKAAKDRQLAEIKVEDALKKRGAAEKRVAEAQKKSEQAATLTNNQVKNLQKSYATLLNSLKSSEGKYPVGTLEQLKLEISTILTELKALNNELGTNAPTEEQSARVEQLKDKYVDLSTQLKTVTAETEKNTTAVIQNGDSILSMAKKFIIWQAAATVVMQPLNAIRNALSNIKTTLIETEDTVVELQRVIKSDVSYDRMTEDLYELAEAYGQTRENVSDLATAFAKAGYDYAEALQATEAALLALNVAELDAEEASDGLIAVMKQFNLEASDLLLVIDKLNITADNAAVTTSDLLAALQRVGSAAVNANLSLNDTVSLITALSEATGRSGENIGTALNALINFSKKDSSLDVFASLGGDTESIVEKYRNGGASILEVWKSLAGNIQSLNANQSLYESADFDTLNEELKTALGEEFGMIQDIYGTASTYRQNYFIALLNNMDEVQAATEKLKDAEGYSQSENEKYLETYTAKVNSLTAAWQKLAAQEDGILDIFKNLADVGTKLAKVTEKIGGLKTVLTAIGGILATMFADKIFTKLSNFRLQISQNINVFKSFKNAIQASKTAQDAQTAATQAQTTATQLQSNATATAEAKLEAETLAKKAETLATEQATAATAAWGAAIQSAVGWISIIVTAITAIVGAVKEYNAEVEQARQKTIDDWETSKSGATAYNELYKEYTKYAEIKDKTAEEEAKYANAQAKIVDSLGERASALDKLTKGTSEYTEALNKLTQAEYKQYAIKAQAAANAAKTELANYNSNPFEYGSEYTPSISDWKYLDLGEKISAIFNLLPNTILNSSNKIGAQKKQIAGGAFSQYSELEKLIGELYEGGYENTEDFTSAVNRQTELESVIKTYLDAAISSNFYSKAAESGFPDTEEEINNIISLIISSTGATSVWKDYISKAVKELANFSEETQTVEKATDNIVTNIEKISDKVREELVSALKEARNEEEEALALAEKQLAVEEARAALENAQKDRSVRVYNAATGRFELQADQKQINSAQETLDDAISALNDYVEEQAWDEVITAIDDGTATNDAILTILTAWAKEAIGDTGWQNKITSIIGDKTGIILGGGDSVANDQIIGSKNSADSHDTTYIINGITISDTYARNATLGDILGHIDLVK